MKNRNKKSEAVRLFYEVHKISMHSLRKNFENLGITMPQGLVIRTLIKFGQMKISELSEKVNLSNSTISGIVDRLEKQDLVVRQRSEKDRRIVYVNITPKLEEIHKKTYKETGKSFESLLSAGSPEDLEKVIEGLTTLKKILQANVSNE